MNILVLDVAASESGALSVLKQYYRDLQSDTQNRYFFCVSKPELESQGNVQVLRFPWVKKSWLHRLWFELVWVKKLIQKYNVDRIFSLQNLILGNPRCEKWIYLHMVIPFAGVSFSIIKEPKMWVYKNVIGKLILHSLKKADRVILQTRWMKSACVRQAGLSANSVIVETPDIPVDVIEPCTDRGIIRNKLFYPATPLKYKNHMLVLSALKLLKDSNELGDLQLDLTMTGQENDLSKQIFQYARDNQLPVNFLGSLPLEEVMHKYAHSTLIFPSYIESFGLPLLEARRVGTIVLASDCNFSHEILEYYDAAEFFDPFDAKKCAEKIKEMKDSCYK